MPNPDQLDRYIENGGFWLEHIPHEGGTLLHAPLQHAAYQDWAVDGLL